MVVDNSRSSVISCNEERVWEREKLKYQLTVIVHFTEKGKAKEKDRL